MLKLWQRQKQVKKEEQQQATERLKLGLDLHVQLKRGSERKGTIYSYKSLFCYKMANGVLCR